MSIKITCRADKFADYIKSYRYSILKKEAGFTWVGFLKATDEFQEWFEYIIDFFVRYDIDNQIISYKEMLTYNDLPFIESSSSFITCINYFTFEFTDEEKALYFKMKYED